MTKLLRFFNTVKYLKFKQIRYRLFYLIRNKLRKFVGFSYSNSKSSHSQKIFLQKSIYYNETFTNNTFIFLNQKKLFEIQVDWNYNKNGKLWTYNLNYFDYLNQERVDKDIFNNFIKSYIENFDKLKDGLEPYPLSLRGINWIKYFVYYNIKNKKIDDCLYAQYYILLDNLEFHLLGNHLLENGFSLLFGAYYFEDYILYENAKKILIEELSEQILSDGAHFELSPMYHQIILYRLLDCINVIKNNSWQENELLNFLLKKVELMLSWLHNVTYKNGDIPHVNDSTYDIAPKSEDLFLYATQLGIEYNIKPLGESGYRKIEYKDFEFFLDIGNIGPDYISGHAHADTFNFELYIHKKPFIVDPGISTYENNELRKIQKSTMSHNTVAVGNKSSSNLWSSFRVAERAKVVLAKETPHKIVSIHNGYSNLKINHKREFTWLNNITIEDTLIGKPIESYAYFHFAPNIECVVQGNKVIIKNIAILFFEDILSIELDNYNYSLGFNKSIIAKKIKVAFIYNYKITIQIMKG